MAPTHKDGISDEDTAKFLFDNEEEKSIVDLPVLVPKIIVLVTALFMALMSASPKIPGMNSDTWFVVTGSLTLVIIAAIAAWFETLIYRGIALGSIWAILFIIVAGLIMHLPDPSAEPSAARVLGITALIASLVTGFLFVRRRMLYPKLEFFLPATGLLCALSISIAL